MRHAALGVFEGVLIGTALVAAAVLSARLLQEGAPPPAGPSPTEPSQEALRSSAGVVLLTGLLAGMGGAALTAWLALAPLDSWFRRGGLAMVSAFGTVVAMLVLVPVDQAFGRAGLAATLAVLLVAALWLARSLRRSPARQGVA